MKDTFVEYNDKVMDYLEYLYYPELVIYWKPEDVAQSIHNCMIRLYALDISYRMCAILIFSATMNYKVIPSAEAMTIQ
jgi:hypothetical protein